jgi:hypothetical protein
MFFLWGGFPPKEQAAAYLALGFPYLLSFPLAVSAILIWKPSGRLLWIMALLRWLGVIGMSYRDFDPGPFKFVISVAECTYQILPLVILAGLVQYGCRFFQITRGSDGYKWSGAVNGNSD